MSSHQITINLTGRNSVGGALKGAAGEIQSLGTEASKTGTTIGQSINKGVTTATGSFTKLKASASNTFGSISAGAKAASDSLGGLGQVITGIAGGIGLMEVAQAMWTGSTTKQFNEAYLQTKMSSDAATSYIAQIQQIVAEVPGDDTYMNNLMTGAVAKQTNLTTAELKAMGIASADYLTTSKAMGKSQIETQMDLKEYLLTGNTSQLERDSILKQQMETLEGQGTVSERILALNKALQAEGYAGLSQLDIASIKWEEVKGKVQLAATTIGEKVLPYVEKFLNFILDLDEKTNGMSSVWLVIGGTIGLLALALAPVVGATMSGYYAMKNYRIEAEKAAAANALNKGPGTGTGAGTGGANWAAVAGGLVIAAATIYITHAAIEAATVRLGDPNYTPTAGGQPLSPEDNSLGKGIKQGMMNEWGNNKLLQGLAPTMPLGLDIGLQNFDLAKQVGSMLNPGGALGKGLGSIKWPSATQILTSIKNVLVPSIPKLNWKLPSVGQILRDIGDRINPLNWRIPGVGDLLAQTWQKISDLFWKIPNPGDLLAQTWQKISQLIWQIPSAGDILGAVRAMIPAFSWPWGPGGGTRASNVATNIGNRASALLASGPRGPLTSMVSGTISSMSGLSQGNIASAMSKRFKGVSAFTDIADAMASHLGYEFYMGDQKSNRQVWDSGTCNCYDGAQFLVSEASRKMVSDVGMQNGVWNGTSIPHTWATIGGRPFDMAGMLLRGSWTPPSGPGQDFAQFMTDIGPGLEYIGYAGHAIDPLTALSQGGNCFDMTLGLMNIASGLFGLPSNMVWGTYGGNSHVWANIAGRDYDPSRRALEGTWSPPPRGPSGSGRTIIINGDVYGYNDFKKKVEQANNDTISMF